MVSRVDFSGEVGENPFIWAQSSASNQEMIEDRQLSE